MWQGERITLIYITKVKNKTQLNNFTHEKLNTFVFASLRLCSPQPPFLIVPAVSNFCGVGWKWELCPRIGPLVICSDDCVKSNGKFFIAMRALFEDSQGFPSAQNGIALARICQEASESVDTLRVAAWKIRFLELSWRVFWGPHPTLRHFPADGIRRSLCQAI